MSQFRIVSRRFLRRLLNTLPIVLPAALGLAFAVPMHAQTPAAAAPAPDVIVFTNGDQLTGKLLREVGGSVTFHSDMAGDVTVTWDKIKSIHTAQQFAVIQQGQHVTRKTADADIAQGSVQVEDNQVKVTARHGRRDQRHSGEECAIRDRQGYLYQGTARQSGLLLRLDGLDHRGRNAGGGDAEQPQLYRRGGAGKGYSQRELA